MMICTEAGSLSPKEPALLSLEAGHEQDPVQPGYSSKKAQPLLRAGAMEH